MCANLLTQWTSSLFLSLECMSLFSSLLLTDNNSYDKNCEQMNTYQKSVTRKEENDERRKSNEVLSIYRLFEKSFNHLTWTNRKKTRFLREKIPLWEEIFIYSTYCQLVSGGVRSPIVVNVNVDQYKQRRYMRAIWEKLPTGFGYDQKPTKPSDFETMK